MKKKPNKKSQTIDNAVLLRTVLYAASSGLAVLFLLSVIQVGQNIRQGITTSGSPNSFAAWPSLIIALYLWTKTTKSEDRYVLVAIIASLAVGMVIWLLGMTAAGANLIA